MGKVRCSVCDRYVPKEEALRTGIQSVCSTACRWEAQHRPKPRRVSGRTGRKRTSGIDKKLRMRVKRRDGHRCRWCSTLLWQQGEGEVHHIRYRSEGGLDEEANLILLCGMHHRMAHSNKRIWQPVLLAVIWKEYVEGRWMSVPQVSRHLEVRGIHPAREAAS